MSDVSEIKIVKATFSSEGSYELPPDPDTGEARIANLFMENKSAWRFEGDDGRYAIIRVDNDVFDSYGHSEVEAKARRDAIKQLERDQGAA